MMNKKTIKKSVLMLALSGAMLLTAGSAVAYFTDKEQAENHITIGKVDITLTEPEWEKLPDDEKEDITPGKKIIKDPRITNVGINDAFVFMTVEVPAAQIITANEDGTRNEKALTELFSWEVNKGWVQIGNAKDVLDGEKRVIARKYLYAYGTADKCTALSKGIATSELFSSVTFVNVIEGQHLTDGTPMEEAHTNINLNAYAIQTTDLTQNKVTSPKEVWAVLKNQNGLEE